jgi:translation initiation factor 5B
MAHAQIDRCYGWVPHPHVHFRESFAQQNADVKAEFKHRLQGIVTAFAEKSINAALYFENPDPLDYISIVPTSAVTGEGLPDLLNMLIGNSQRYALERIMHHDFVQCTVLEVKVIEGLGTTIDVILINGTLHEGDTVVMCGLDGPIVTQIRALLTPQPLREMRVKVPPPQSSPTPHRTSTSTTRKSPSPWA